LRARSLGGCETDKFGAGKGKSSGDEDAAQAFETVVKSAWVAPQLTTNVTSLYSTSTINDCAKNTTSDVNSYYKRDSGTTYMYPIIAMTLMVEKKNSASPYPLTPNKLIEIITTRNIVTNIA
jgi:hypothetical protein